jgi:hypothetical protein
MASFLILFWFYGQVTLVQSLTVAIVANILTTVGFNMFKERVR